MLGRANEEGFMSAMGLTNEEIQMLWDTGARMTMPGGRPDFYVSFSRKSIEFILGPIHDDVIHPDQDQPGYLRLKRADGQY